MNQPPNVVVTAAAAAPLTAPAAAAVTHAPVPETPTGQIVAAANNTASKVDKRGRKITVRRIEALQTYRLTKILGPIANNESSLNMAMTAASVIGIGDEQIPFPAKESEIEAMIQRLDFDGMDAAMKAIAEFSEDGSEIAAKN